MITFVCMLFFPEHSIKGEGESREAAMAKAEEVLRRRGIVGPLTYRPADGTVYRNYSHIPCGLVFPAVKQVPVTAEGVAKVPISCTCSHKGTSVNHLRACPMHEPGPDKEMFALEERFLTPEQIELARRVWLR